MVDIGINCLDNLTDIVHITIMKETQKIISDTNGSPGYILNPQSPIPLYRQLADILAARIRSGEYPVATRIPSENSLSAAYGIGRPTARQATEYLIRRGLLIRKRGSGTYVQAKSSEVNLFSLGGTLSAFQKEGIDVSTRLSGPARKLFIANDEENPLAGKEACFISRISAVDEKPVLLEEMFLSTELFPGIDNMVLEGKSISRIVEDRYYLKPSGGKQTFCVTEAGKERGGHLGISGRTPVLQVKRFLDFPRMECGIYAALYCVTDRFVFSQTLGGVFS
jgi:GntR family transcriptional regulator